MSAPTFALEMSLFGCQFHRSYTVSMGGLDALVSQRESGKTPLKCGRAICSQLGALGAHRMRKKTTLKSRNATLPAVNSKTSCLVMTNQ
jgi:hypothetical protein